MGESICSAVHLSRSLKCFFPIIKIVLHPEIMNFLLSFEFKGVNHLFLPRELPLLEDVDFR